MNLTEKQKLYLNQTFKDIQLPEIVLTDKEFDGCQFINCNFSDATFKQCKFTECTFKNCNLSMVKVPKTAFYDTAFEDSKLIGVNWTQASWPNIKLSSPIRFIKCILNDSSFLGLCIKEIIMMECKAHDVDLRDADCSHANFTHTDFTLSLFNKTNLTQADFSDATNYAIDVFANDIKQAKFTLPEAVNLLKCLDIELVD